METYQIYEHGRVLVCQVRAKSHADAANEMFSKTPTLKFIDIGRKGTGPEWRFTRGGSPVKVKKW